MCSPFRAGPAGRAEVREFCANRFLPNIPPDWELTSLSETFGCDRIVEEFVVRFTHTLQMDWMLPGVPATDRGVEFAMALIIQFEGSKIANERRRDQGRGAASDRKLRPIPGANNSELRVGVQG